MDTLPGMKVLFIGGTGNISTRVSLLAVERGIDLYHLNRGKRRPNFPGARSIAADIHDESAAARFSGNNSPRGIFTLKFFSRRNTMSR